MALVMIILAISIYCRYCRIIVFAFLLLWNFLFMLFKVIWIYTCVYDILTSLTFAYIFITFFTFSKA